MANESHLNTAKDPSKGFLKETALSGLTIDLSLKGGNTANRHGEAADEL